MKHDDTTLQAAIDAAMHETRKNNSCKSFAACKKSWPKSWLKESPARLALAKAFLAKLPKPEPILADDGRSLGQVAYEAPTKFRARLPWEEASNEARNEYQTIAQAVACVVLAQAIRRMEAVPVEEVAEIIRRQWLDRGGWIEPAAEIESMREAIKEAYEALTDVENRGRDFDEGNCPYALTSYLQRIAHPALAKLKPFLKP